MPLYKALLLFGEHTIRKRLATVHRNYLTNREMSRVRYTIYRWVARHLGYQSKTRHFECVYALTESYFGQSKVGFHYLDYLQ